MAPQVGARDHSGKDAQPRLNLLSGCSGVYVLWLVLLSICSPGSPEPH